MKSSNMNSNDWWAELPAGEKELIRNFMQLLKGAKQSQIRDVANAANEWERALGCFIKVRLKSLQRIKMRRLTSCRSTSRNQPGVSPNQD